jgi:triacylglycerol lipase
MYLPPLFDKAIAREAAALVNQAYDLTQQGSVWSLQGNYDELGRLFARPKWAIAPEPFGFVARNRISSLVFVVYRGTLTLHDWLCDLNFPQVPTSMGNVDEGFSGIYSQTAASVTAAIQRVGASPNVVVTGHSLGAALAVLAAADIAANGLAANPELYSFAGPRVGDLTFAADFNRLVTSAWRVVNTEDIVTTVPLATPALAAGVSSSNILTFLNNLGHNLNFEHVGNAIQFTTHTGSILGNHELSTYIAALAA